jgi:RNA polymerase sigma-70 factor (ECF subfamily)
MELATKVGGGADFSRDVLPLQPNLMRVALGLTRNAAEASDLVQDALERALREWSRFTPGTNARAWVTAILSRLFIDGWRRRRRRPALVSLDDMELAGPPPPDGCCDPAPWDSVSDADLERAVAELPDPLRHVFRLNVVDHLSYGDISAALGIPVNTVGTRLMRARRRLRTTLEAQSASPSTSFLVPEPVPHAPARACARKTLVEADGVARAQSARRSINARASAAQGVALVSRPM